MGRFTGIDPIAEDFAHVTPYNYAENRPIDGIDLWGLQYVSAEDAGYGNMMGPYTQEQLALQQQYSQYIDGSDIVTYNNQTYFNVGQHLYMGTDGTISNQLTEGATITTEWVYTDIQLFDQSSHHTFRWADPTLIGNDHLGEPANRNCAYLAGAQADEFGTNLQGGGVSPANALNYSGGTITQLNTAEGIDYINSQLEAGNAIVVGVDYEPGGTDIGTDHYVTITGRTSINGSGRFLFMENATGNATQVRNFNVNRFIPGATNITGGSVYMNGMTLTRIQRNQ